MTPRLAPDQRILLWALAAGAPALAVAAMLLWRVPMDGLARWTVMGALVAL